MRDRLAKILHAVLQVLGLGRPKSKPSPMDDARADFSKAILRGMRAGDVKTLDDVVSVYKGVIGMSADDQTYAADLSRRLLCLFKDVVARNKKVPGIGGEVEDKEFPQLAAALSKFIEAIQHAPAYDDLPAPERDIVVALWELAGKKDPDSLKHKILELAGTIEDRYAALMALRRKNRLAVLGIAVSIAAAVVGWVK